MNRSTRTAALGALLPVLACTTVADAATIVRMETALGEIHVELTPDETPLTVANFLNYTRDMDYDNGFFHRSIEDFIIQAGSFTYASGEYDRIPVDPPVDNEFSGLTPPVNVRGTIAMAKISGDPDSATSGWFFNVEDNSSNLDNQNGGFTVFGSITDADGLAVMDALAALPTIDARTIIDEGIAFGLTNLPVRNYVEGDPFDPDNNLATIPAIYEVLGKDIDITPRLFDFGLVADGGSAQQDFVVSNNSGASIDFATVGTADPLVAPFSISTDTCSGMTIPDGGSCAVTVDFDPVASLNEPEATEETFDITLSGLDAPTVQVPVEGTIAPANAYITLDPADELLFGNVLTGTPTDQTLTVTNQGTAGLTLTGLTFTGPDAASFSESNTCGVLMLDESCDITVTVVAPADGDLSADLVVDSNDPGQPTLTVALTATGVSFLEPRISVPDSFDMGDQFAFRPKTVPFDITNDGTVDMTISGISFTGMGATDLVAAGDCATVPWGETCTETLTWTPTSLGNQTATMIIDSDDPTSPTTSVALFGTSSSDDDDIPDAIEDAGPFGGDANGDGLPDRTQSYVTSFLDANGDYITIWLSTPIARFSDVEIIDNPSPDDAPEGVEFPSGFVSFTISVPPTVIVQVAMIMHSGLNPSSYWKYGPTPDNPTPHWYDYAFDGTTGATFEENVAFIVYADGLRGDDDLLANLRVTDPGGPARKTGGGGGGGGGCTLTNREQSLAQHAEWLLVLLLLAGLAARRYASNAGR